jgi:hypothetical protein
MIIFRTWVFFMVQTQVGFVKMDVAGSSQGNPGKSGFSSQYFFCKNISSNSNVFIYFLNQEKLIQFKDLVLVSLHNNREKCTISKYMSTHGIP